MSSSQPTPCGNASNLEINLLSTAIFTSFILYSISVKASSKIYDKGRRPLLFSIIFILAALAAIAINIATIILGYKHRISLDAIAAVVFALIPGLVSFPRDAFMEVFVYSTIIYLRVFPVRYMNFSYVTIGKPCRDDMEPDNTSAHGCSGNSCTANIYIRKLMLSDVFFPRMSKRIYRSKNVQNNRCFTKIIKDCFSYCPENDSIRWNGLVLEHQPTVVMVRNLAPVQEQKWYMALSSSVWLVMQPWNVHLSRPAHVVCALRVVSDILAIGRLVIHFRGEIIFQFINELDFEEDSKAKAAVQICNLIIKEIGLIEWGQLDVSQIRRFATRRTSEEQLGEMYSLLLLLVIYKSNLFGDWFHHRSQEEEKDTFYRFGSNDIKDSMQIMEEGHIGASMMVNESSGSENDTISNETPNKAEDNVHVTRQGSEKKQNKIYRAELVSRVVRWLGWLINGTMPFHDPHQVAQFRHDVTSFKMIKKINEAAINGRCRLGINDVMHKQVDSWLASWKCIATKAHNTCEKV